MKYAILLLVFIPSLLSGQSEVEEVLAKAVNYHDPNGNWTQFKATLFFKETRPAGPDRKTTVMIDNQNGRVEINRNEEERYEIEGEKVQVLQGDREEARGVLLRNYYLYLWGLPMKLMDEGTPFDRTLYQEEVAGQKCDVIRVVYEKDTWYFCFDMNGKLIQYKFYQDEEETEGELITLEDEVEIQGIRIPQKRSWYTLPDMKYLGTDILERFN